MNHPLKLGQPRFLSKEEVLTLHSVSLNEYGGADGFLDEGALESALAQARQGFGEEFVHEFPFGMAAAYGYHIAMNHAFRDGNKRTAFAAMVVFLRMNGWDFEMPDGEAAGLLIEMIERRRDKVWLSEQLVRRSRARVSMELRDFFALASPDRFVATIRGLNAGSRSELEASGLEALDLIPVLRVLEQWKHQYREQGREQEELATAYAQAVVISLFRMAEDLGYQW